MRSKRLTAPERRVLRALLFAELEGRVARVQWSAPVRALIWRGMLKPIAGSFETSSGGRAILHDLTPRGRACARQLWWSRLHGHGLQLGFSSKTYNPLTDRADLLFLLHS